jgi:hypothetical protein
MVVPLLPSDRGTMKRSTIALAVCTGLCACSGQSNTDINSLASGKRDAAADREQAEDEQDAGPDDLPDATDGEPDAGDTAGQDAGEASSADASELDRDSGLAGDAGAQGGDAGSTGGDAGGDPNQLRVRLAYEGQFPVQASIFFSQADGGVESVRTIDGQGLVVSDSAPAMVTTALPGRSSGTDRRYELLTVVAPALGDFIVIEPALEPGASTQIIRYLATVGSVPAGGRSVFAYAGVDGCSQGYQDLVPVPTAPMQIGQRPTCQLESGGSLIAVMRDEADVLLRFAGVALPTAAASPLPITLDQWLAPEDVTLRLANAPSATRPAAYLWMRKGALTVPADRPADPPVDAIPFRVARSLADSFEATGWFTRSASFEHLFAKNRPASAAEINMDLNEALPELDRAQLSTTYQPLLQPSARWGVVGGSTPADALVVVFTWSWLFNADTTAMLSWIFVAPPDTTSLTVPALPNTGPFGIEDEVPADAELQFAGVEYYDSDAQSGYRDFLRERLRQGGVRSGSRRSGNLVRDIPTGGNTRMARFSNGRE